MILALTSLPRRLKRLLIVGYDLAATAGAMAAGAWLGGTADAPSLSAVTLGTCALAGFAVTVASGSHRHVLRFGSMGTVRRLAITVVAATAAAVAVGVVLKGTGLPIRSLVAYGLVLAPLLMLPRLVVAALYQRQSGHGPSAAPTLIYGAGAAGTMLCDALKHHDQYTPVALVDDAPELEGRIVNDIKVYPPDRLGELISRYNVQTVIVATPSASAEERQAILRRLEPYPVFVKTLPPLPAMLGTGIHADSIQDIPPQDLLWRTPVAPDPDLLDHDVRNRIVLVTGGGGSIGSELCRQILMHAPRRLLVCEMTEFALYNVEMELEAMRAGMGDAAPDVVYLLGSICDQAFTESIFRAHDVETVYHAAAYKHVPLVEMCPLSGLYNNVIGTLTVVRQAIAHRARKVVLISTDKAVRPTNLMGASKRFAEQILQALQAEGCETRLTMVRFGNVLNSAGSVVPRFREQIAQGGPVTITHPDITRYFMTIPEAVELVLQAGALGEGGDVFVLDMGEPVRIQDLARRMIHLSGHTVRDEQTPYGDIPITYIGLRPGEKLHEELVIGVSLAPTPHSKVMRAQETFIPWGDLSRLITALQSAIHDTDASRGIAICREAVPEYEPASHSNAVVMSAAQGARTLQADPVSQQPDAAPRDGVDLSTGLRHL